MTSAPSPLPLKWRHFVYAVGQAFGFVKYALDATRAPAVESTWARQGQAAVFASGAAMLVLWATLMVTRRHFYARNMHYFSFCSLVCSTINSVLFYLMPVLPGPAAPSFYLQRLSVYCVLPSLSGRPAEESLPLILTIVTPVHVALDVLWQFDRCSPGLSATTGCTSPPNLPTLLLCRTVPTLAAILFVMVSVSLVCEDQQDGFVDHPPNTMAACTTADARSPFSKAASLHPGSTRPSSLLSIAGQVLSGAAQCSTGVLAAFRRFRGAVKVMWQRTLSKDIAKVLWLLTATIMYIQIIRISSSLPSSPLEVLFGLLVGLTLGLVEGKDILEALSRRLTAMTEVAHDLVPSHVAQLLVEERIAVSPQQQHPLQRKPSADDSLPLPFQPQQILHSGRSSNCGARAGWAPDLPHLVGLGQARSSGSQGDAQAALMSWQEAQMLGARTSAAGSVRLHRQVSQESGCLLAGLIPSPRDSGGFPGGLITSPRDSNSFPGDLPQYVSPRGEPGNSDGHYAPGDQRQAVSRGNTAGSKVLDDISGQQRLSGDSHGPRCQWQGEHQDGRLGRRLQEQGAAGCSFDSTFESVAPVVPVPHMPVADLQQAGACAAPEASLVVGPGVQEGQDCMPSWVQGPGLEGQSGGQAWLREGAALTARQRPPRITQRAMTWSAGTGTKFSSGPPSLSPMQVPYERLELVAGPGRTHVLPPRVWDADPDTAAALQSFVRPEGLPASASLPTDPAELPTGTEGLPTASVDMAADPPAVSAVKSSSAVAAAAEAEFLEFHSDWRSSQENADACTELPTREELERQASRPRQWPRRRSTSGVLHATSRPAMMSMDSPSCGGSYRVQEPLLSPLVRTSNSHLEAGNMALFGPGCPGQDWSNMRCLPHSYGRQFGPSATARQPRAASPAGSGLMPMSADIWQLTASTSSARPGVVGGMGAMRGSLPYHPTGQAAGQDAASAATSSGPSSQQSLCAMLLSRWSVSMERFSEAGQSERDRDRATYVPTTTPPRLLAFSHRAVTVLFADIVGFTTLSKNLDPYQVFEFLNELYARYDAVVDQYRVYKVETIGDCYMCATGLLNYDPEHAAQMVRFALEMQRQAAQVQMPDGSGPVQVRVGIHSGPALSGVIGRIRKRYCVVGSTVNLASRMESTGVPGRVHVSADTHTLLRQLHPHEFQWECRGEVEVKGAGSMVTYLLRQAEAD